MPINDKFLAARAAERGRRLITYLPHPPALRLPLAWPDGFWGRLGRLLRGSHLLTVLAHYTERQRIELFFACNAFLTGLPPTHGDVQYFLWRLHPDFIRPDGELPNRRHPGQPPRYATPAEVKRSLRILRSIERLVPLVDLAPATGTIRGFLAGSEQDRQGATDATVTVSRVAPEPNPWDDLCEYFGRDYGLTRDEVLDSPRAWLFQLHRSHVLRTDPEGDLKIFAPSDDFLAGPPSGAPAPA